jgi:hypothetical protein
LKKKQTAPARKSKQQAPAMKRKKRALSKDDPRVVPLSLSILRMHSIFFIHPRLSPFSSSRNLVASLCVSEERPEKPSPRLGGSHNTPQRPLHHTKRCD